MSANVEETHCNAGMRGWGIICSGLTCRSGGGGGANTPKSLESSCKESGIISGGVACTVSVQKRLFLG